MKLHSLCKDKLVLSLCYYFSLEKIIVLTVFLTRFLAFIFICCCLVHVVVKILYQILYQIFTNTYMDQALMSSKYYRDNYFCSKTKSPPSKGNFFFHIALLKCKIFKYCDYYYFELSEKNVFGLKKTILFFH